jgi:hypothetical protein
MDLYQYLKNTRLVLDNSKIGSIFISMKTQFKTYSQEQIKNKKSEYESIYGVSFSYYQTGNGYNIHPVLDVKVITEDSTNSEIVLNFVLTQNKMYATTFDIISDNTGLTIKESMQAALYLVRNQKLSCNVDRMGKFVGVHKL